MQIKFRPHHFLCTLCFQGRGYSSTFVNNYQNIVNQLQSQGEHTITVVSKTDSICDPCPNRIDELCTTQDKITRLDDAHAAALDLEMGESLTWDEAKKRIKNKMTLDVFHRICEPCGWKKFGFCEDVLTEFLK